MDLTGKVAVITGSAGGIGRGIAERFAAHGAHVYITSRNLDRAKNVAEEIASNGGQTGFCYFELENQTSGGEMIETVSQQCGRLDILVNNAISHPTLPPAQLQDICYEKLEAGIVANLTNVIYLTSQAHKYLKKSGGNVINIGSATVTRNLLGIPLYTILKGAISQMTKTLAAEWAADSIRVNQINPGMIQTESYKNSGVSEDIFAERVKKYLQLHPLGRVGVPKDIGGLTAFLASDAADWITGAEMAVDGGFSVQGLSLSLGDK